MKKVLLFSALLLLPIIASSNQASLKTLQKSIQRDQENQDLKLRFAGIATGIDLSALETKKTNEKQDLSSELKNLAAPLLQSIKRVSERPRKIEELKDKIEFSEKLIIDIETAQEKISKLLKMAKYKPYQKELLAANKILVGRYDTLLLDLDLSQSELSKILGQKKSLIETIRQVMGTFLKTKGKNLLIALLGFLAVATTLGFLKKKIFRLSFFYGRFAVLRKPLSAFYSVLTSLLALVAAILCLYALDDWLLVTIIVFLLMGLGWSLKNYIPQFFDEIKLVLNFGAVREGEKIVYDGIPWRVDKLSFYSRLSNDRLDGGSIRISAKKLVDCHSRKVGRDEDWFPTKKGDWVLIDGKTLGHITSQTPDRVVIDRAGGGILNVSCIDFLSQQIENLSSGFSVTQLFGVDYSLQKNFSQGLLEDFENSFVEKLSTLPGVMKVSVEFGDCGADSLNTFVGMDCDGSIANKYFRYKRLMQKTFLDLCNERNFDIPFKQLTVHMSNNG